MTPHPLILASLLLLPACVVFPIPIPAQTGPRQQTGVQRIVGKPPETVTALLGRPTLDHPDGAGRLLQFTRNTCTLDVFLFPTNRSSGMTARRVAARAVGGGGMDAGECIEAQVAAYSRS